MNPWAVTLFMSAQGGLSKHACTRTCLTGMLPHRCTPGQKRSSVVHEELEAAHLEPASDAGDVAVVGVDLIHDAAVIGGNHAPVTLRPIV